MGKTRTKLIDDSQPTAEVKSQKLKFKSEETRTPRKKEADSLVAKLKEELGIEEKTHPQSSTLKKPSSIVHYPSSKKIRSKKYLEASKELDRTKTYPLPEALDIVKNKSYSKFNGTLEIHILASQTGLHGFISLPYVSGRKIRILAFGKGAENSGAGIFGDDSTIDEISKGKINFDILITTPEWMPKLTKVARILGPRGLMPNPKNETITDDLKKAVGNFQAGKTEFKTEAKAPVIHLGIGKLAQPNEELEANIRTLLQTIGKTRVRKATLSPTMGPGVKLDLTTV